ncbi:MAG: histidinol-phosphate transaminase [Congregibacter sp.]
MLSRRGFIGGTAAAVGALQLVQPTGALAANLFGPAAGIAKLNANENPYGPSAKALRAMAEASAKGAYYVGPSVGRLQDMILERFSLKKEHLTLSAGSSGALADLARAKSSTGKILGTDLFWDTTTRMALRQGGELVRTPKRADLAVDLDALYAAITPDTSLVHICNPNNPTAMMLPHETLRDFCIKASKKCTVLIDEAYNEITDDPENNSVVSLIREGHDIVVARTFSKIYGLAGMRVGYMMALPETTELIQSYGLGNYTLNQAGVAAAVASFDDEDFIRFSRDKLYESREMIVKAVYSEGLSAAPSQASFVFVNLGDLNAELLRAELAKRGVLIRGIYQDYTTWSRVSTGLTQDVAKYVAELPAALAAVRAMS